MLSRKSRSLAITEEGQRYFEQAQRIVADVVEAESVVRSNRAYAIVMLPQGLERAVLRGEAGRVLVFYNASYSTPSGSVLREVGAVIQSQARTLAAQQSAAILGPGSLAVAHTANERVEVADLVAAARINARTIVRFLGAG